MKRLLLVFALLVSMLAANAQTAEEITFINTVVKEMNKNTGSVKAASGGVITKCSVARSGKNIVMNLHLGTREVNFAKLSASEKRMFSDELGNAFLEGMMESIAYDEDAIAGMYILKEIGTKFVLKVYDYKGNVVTSTINLNSVF